AASPENLRMIRGSIDGNGSTDAGSGFTSSRFGEGAYRIVFDVPFASIPSVTVSAIQPFGQSPRWATVVSSTFTPGVVDIWVLTSSNDFTDSDFHFIAVGPR